MVRRLLTPFPRGDVRLMTNSNRYGGSVFLIPNWRKSEAPLEAMPAFMPTVFDPHWNSDGRVGIYALQPVSGADCIFLYTSRPVRVEAGCICSAAVISSQHHIAKGSNRE